MGVIWHMALWLRQRGHLLYFFFILLKNAKQAISVLTTTAGQLKCQDLKEHIFFNLIFILHQPSGVYPGHRSVYISCSGKSQKSSDVYFK